MADESTKVTYDVSQAISAVNKLAETIDNATGRIVDAFEKSETASKRAESGLGNIQQAANDLSGGVLGVATDVGILVGSFIGAVVAGQRLADMVARNTFGFEEAAGQIEDFIRQADKFRDVTQGGRDIGNAATNTQLERQLFLLSRSQQAEIRARAQGLAAEQAANNNKLQAQRQYYSELDSIAQKSANNRQKLEERLSDLVARTNERRFLNSISRFNDNAQISKIIDEAGRLQDKGGDSNLSQAENLLDKALGKAEGNTANVKRVEEAINSLIRARQREADQAAQANQADEKRAQAAANAVKQTQAETEAIRAKQRALQEQTQNNAVQRADAQRQQQDNRRQQEFDAARLKAQVELAALNRVSQTPVTTGERANASFGGLLGREGNPLLISDAEVQRQRNLVDQITALQDKINNNLQKNPTPQGFQDNIKDITQLQELVEFLAGTDNLSAAFKPDLSRLQQGSKLLDRIRNTMQEISGSSGFLDGRGPERFNPVRPNPAPNPNQGASVPAPRAVNQNINVDLQVRGGMIDSDTIQQVTERVAREIRKGTAQQA